MTKVVKIKIKKRILNIIMIIINIYTFYKRLFIYIKKNLYNHINIIIILVTINYN